MSSHVYFPCSGAISITISLPSGSEIEVGSVGREGGLAAGWDPDFPDVLSRGTVLMSGIFSVVPIRNFRLASLANRELRDAALACKAWILVQAQQRAACNAIHSADARLCRWLLQYDEYTDDGTIPLTQETIAQLLGIQRTTLSLLAQRLQIAGALRCSRGRITIRDRAALERQACGCQRIIGRCYWPSELILQHAAPASMRTGVKPG